MFWGSFRGIYATELTDNGLEIKKTRMEPQSRRSVFVEIVLKGPTYTNVENIITCLLP